MYPNLYYLFKDLFNVSIPALKIINTFGFCVAISFLGAAYFLIIELKRKQGLGQFTYKETTIAMGEPATAGELISNFIFGFILGYKLLGIFTVEGALNDPQLFFFSTQGSLPAGLLIGAFLTALKWWDKNKNKLAKPEKRTIRIWPSDRVGDMTILAAIFGFAGAKLFDNFENWDRFIQDPIGNLLSPSGLTFYGGLIVAAIALWVYFRRNNISFIKVADAIAPSLMFAYGWGRVGCQVAGDGDWGILNTAYVSNGAGQTTLAATADDYLRTVQANTSFYVNEFGSLNVPHKSVRAFFNLPDWLFAYTYPHNVNKTGIPILGCNWDDYCNHLPVPVFPTPIYEIIVCLIMFGVLWAVRKNFATSGRFFGLYLLMNGVERFLVEHIRVNTQYHFWGINPTQAEIISLFLVAAGVFLLLRKTKEPIVVQQPTADTPTP